MAGLQTSKILLHATVTEGEKVHRWVVAAFANKTAAGMFAGMLKQAHAANDSALIAKLDPGHAKNAKGVPLTPVKLSAQEVPYNPHATVGSGLDEE